jgi:hypothetical protein
MLMLVTAGVYSMLPDVVSSRSSDAPEPIDPPLLLLCTELRDGGLLSSRSVWLVAVVVVAIDEAGVVEQL